MTTITQNTSGLQLRKAMKSKSKLRVGISGPSGSGKTYSALLIAGGLTDWEKVCIIDTENGSADVYDKLGAYNVITLEPPFSPERYVEAIKAAEDAGMEVIIIDSVTHEWDGKGGCLESNELMAQSKFKGNSWAAWSQTTPRHQKFINGIVSSKCHVITTARSKTETIQVDNKIKKVGTKEIQREGFEYELTLNFNLDRDTHLATASKDRTGMFIDTDPFVITPSTGEKLRTWADEGVDMEKIKAEEEKIRQEEEKKRMETEKKAILNAAKTVRELLQKKGKSEGPILETFKVDHLEDLNMKQINMAINKLITLPDLDPNEVVNSNEVDEGIEKMRNAKNEAS